MANGVKYVAWAMTAVALVLLIVMNTVTLPHLAGLGGDRMFDLKVRGYDFPVAQAILQRLGPDGAAYYANIQQRLDDIFLVTFCLASVYWLIAAARRWQGFGLPLIGPVLAAIIAVPVIAGTADLGENAGVSTMLAVGAASLTPGMVRIASLFTLAKFYFDGVAMLTLVVLAAGPSVAGLLRRLKR